MHVRSLRSFLAVHRWSTVVVAAQKVHLSQAAVSVQLKRLEEELGVALFKRTGRSLQLTPEALQLVPMAEHMLAILGEMCAIGGAGGPSGMLRLGVINSALAGSLPSWLHTMSAEHTELDIKVVAGISTHLVDLLCEGQLDAAIVTCPDRLRAGLQIAELYREPFVLIGPRGFKATSTAEALACFPYLAFDRSAWAGAMVSDYLARSGILARPAMELNSMEAITALVGHGLGVSIVPQVRGLPGLCSASLDCLPIAGFERAVALVERVGQVRPWLAPSLRRNISAMS